MTMAKKAAKTSAVKENVKETAKEVAPVVKETVKEAAATVKAVDNCAPLFYDKDSTIRPHYADIKETRKKHFESRYRYG